MVRPLSKICAKCGQTKLLTEYHSKKDGKLKRQSVCKPCKRNYQRKTEQTESYKLRRKIRQNLPKRVAIKREYDLKRRFGITSNDYNNMLVNQNYSCALCTKSTSEFTKRLAVDHNHSTGKIRGLLCFYCNKWRVGKLNKEWAQKVLEYLVKYDG